MDILRNKQTVLRLCAPLPSLLVLLGMLAGEELSPAMMLLFSLLLHECGHLLAFFCLRAGPLQFAGEAGGFLLSPSRGLLPREEALAAAAGPLANLSAAVLCGGIGIMLGFPLPLFVFASVNLLSGLCNLIPLWGCDGGRLMYLLLSHFLGEEKARRCLRGSSLLLIGLSFFISAYLFYRGLFGISLPLFAGATLWRVLEE